MFVARKKYLDGRCPAVGIGLAIADPQQRQSSLGENFCNIFRTKGVLYGGKRPGSAMKTGSGPSHAQILEE
ncbi:MAG: hypothetical protein KAY65_06970 [Planctomycetes bacterium]|nr:hypothetical protein [Planctomycetota bacterium]